MYLNNCYNNCDMSPLHYKTVRRNDLSLTRIHEPDTLYISSNIRMLVNSSNILKSTTVCSLLSATVFPYHNDFLDKTLKRF